MYLQRRGPTRGPRIDEQSRLVPNNTKRDASSTFKDLCPLYVPFVLYVPYPYVLFLTQQAALQLLRVLCYY